MKKLLLAACTAVIIVPLLRVNIEAEQASVTHEQSPKLLISNTIDKIIKVVQKYPDDSLKEKRREELRKIINPYFDFKEMSFRSLTKWKEISESERETFVELFSDLLSKTYLKRLERVKPGMVEIASEKIRKARFPVAVVKTLVSHNGDTFPIDYKMVKRNDKWQIYDVTIENIGLISNYRNEFSGIIRKEKFSGLIERLKQKASQEDDLS